MTNALSTEELNDLRLRLHNYGKGDWARKICTTDYKSRIADGCIDALDQFDRYESEITQLRLDLAQHLGNVSELIRVQAELERVQNINGHALCLLKTGHVEEAIGVLRLGDDADDCMAAGCDKDQMKGSVLCEEHYNALPERLRAPTRG
jgi:hypothetical protein